jgi:hypothetical protein
MGIKEERKRNKSQGKRKCSQDPDCPDCPENPVYPAEKQ